MMTVSKNLILSALSARKMTAPELASELGQPVDAIKPVLVAMATEGLLGEEDGILFVTEQGESPAEVNEPEGFVILSMAGAPKPAKGKGTSSKPAEEQEGNTGTELTKEEWTVVNLLQDRRCHTFNMYVVAKEVGDEPAKAAIARLEQLGIVEPHKRGYRITAQSELNIPLTADQQKELKRLEEEIEFLAENIEGKMSKVAENLKQIRDQKLYKATHKRFNDYVADRFARTRDWAYKMIQAVEVREGLQEGDDKNVESLIQSLTTREVPHLAKLKGVPANMQKALLKAEKMAKADKRPRTVDDVMKAVAAYQTKGEKPESKPTWATPKVRTITVSGVDFNGGDTDDLPKWLREFAKWLEGNPSDSAFSIKVSKAK